MKRRSFLQGLIATIGGVFAMPALARDLANSWIWPAGFTRPGLTPVNLAEVMHDALERYGVEVLPIDESTVGQGAKMGGRPANGGYWTQRHVDTEEGAFEIVACIDALAKNIAQSCDRIRFGHLQIPQGVEATRYAFRDVTLRDLRTYVTYYDEWGTPTEVIFRRIDVLFVDENRK